MKLKRTSGHGRACPLSYHSGGDDDERAGVLVNDEELEQLHVPVDGVDTVDEPSHLLVLLTRRKAETEGDGDAEDGSHVQRVHYLAEEELALVGEARAVGLQELSDFVKAVGEDVDEDEDLEGGGRGGRLHEDDVGEGDEEEDVDEGVLPELGDGRVVELVDLLAQLEFVGAAAVFGGLALELVLARVLGDLALVDGEAAAGVVAAGLVLVVELDYLVDGKEFAVA